MNPRNYQRELDSLLKKQSGKKTLLLHCCCAPCSSYVLEYLHEYFDITVLFYNPNISEQAEYDKRSGISTQFLTETRSNGLTVTMNRRNLRLLPPAMKRSRNGENGVTVVIIYGFLIRLRWQKKAGMIIFVLPCRSVPTKMQTG